MRKIVLASHGTMAVGMKNSLEMIAGKQECVDAIAAYVPGAPNLQSSVEGAIAALGPDDELILVTDLLGGSVNNELSEFRNRSHVFVVTGMNLALVLGLVLGCADTTEELIQEAVDSARGQVMRILGASEMAYEDEDF